MPTFTTESGSEVYVPFHGMVMCEEQIGGLTTRVWLVGQITDMKNGTVGPVGISVKGTLDTVRLAFITEAFQFAHADKGFVLNPVKLGDYQ